MATPNNTLSLTNIANDPLTAGVVSSLFDTSGNVASDYAQGVEAGYEAEGAGAEATAYGSASSIAQQNATLALVSGQLQQYQQGLQAKQTIGAQQAQVSGAGFASSGSSLALLRSSTQQANIAGSMIGLQAQLTAGGYMEESAASQAEIAAANTAQQAATEQQTAANSAAAISQTNAANEINYLTNTIQQQAINQGLPAQTAQNNADLAQLQNLGTETAGLSPTNIAPSTAALVQLPTTNVEQTPQSVAFATMFKNV